MPKHPFLWPGHASQSGPRMHLTPNPRIHRSVRTQARRQSPDVFLCLVVRDLGDAGQTSTSRFLLNGHNTSAVNTTVRLCWLVFNGLPVLACRVYRLSLRRWMGRGGPVGRWRVQVLGTPPSCYPVRTGGCLRWCSQILHFYCHVPLHPRLVSLRLRLDVGKSLHRT